MTKKITFPRWPSEFPANLGRPLCLSGLTGRHWLAGNSEGHRRISKFLFLMVPYNYHGALATGNREVAFFYHLKSQSYIVLWYLKASYGSSWLGFLEYPQSFLRLHGIPFGSLVCKFFFAVP